jgi:hypothetical protein
MTVERPRKRFHIETIDVDMNKNTYTQCDFRTWTQKTTTYTQPSMFQKVNLYV